MQVPNLIWSELVSHGADSFESGAATSANRFGIGTSVTL
jgi:hypothetical protein